MRQFIQCKCKVNLYYYKRRKLMTKQGTEMVARRDSVTQHPVIGLSNEATVVANSNGNVKTTITGYLTSRKTTIIVGCMRSTTDTRHAIRSVRSLKNLTVTMRTSIYSRSRSSGLINTTISSFNNISVLIGGTFKHFSFSPHHHSAFTKNS